MFGEHMEYLRRFDAAARGVTAHAQVFAISYKTIVAASCRVRQGFLFERSVSDMAFYIYRHGCTCSQPASQRTRCLLGRGFTVGVQVWTHAASLSRPVKVVEGSAGRSVSGGVLLAE
jgi:hypothetical protein